MDLDGNEGDPSLGVSAGAFASHQNDTSFNNGTLSAEETALAALSDHELRVPCYCEENVWRLAYRKKHHDSAGSSRNGSGGDEDHRWWVVFISNAIKSVPMFHQLASADPSKSVCWDYHVILLQAQPQHEESPTMTMSNSYDDRHPNHPASRLVVYDLDSSLPYPCLLSDYLRFSFPFQASLPFSPLFRVVEADLYLQYFCSNRMHMFNAIAGTWKAPPPHYAPIQGAGGSGSGRHYSGRSSSTSTTTTTMTSYASNLHHYLNFVDRPVFTEILEENSNAFGTILTLAQLMQHASSLAPSFA